MRARKVIRVALSVLVVPVGLLCFSAPALAAAPSVGGEGVAFVSPFEARLEATVNAGEEPAGQKTECHVQYGTTSVIEHIVACEQATIEGGEQGIEVTLKGLAKETPYHYQFVLKNATGEQAGTEEAFTTTTPEKPGLESEGVSEVTSTTARLGVQVNPDSQKTSYKFEYATSKAFTGAKTATGELEGYGYQPVSVPVTGLEPGENYYYKLTATNETGTTSGVLPAQSFTTLPVPSTDVPTNVTGTGATFNGHFTLTPQDTRWYFDYARNGTCTGENSTPVIDAGTGTSVVKPEWTVPSPENPGVWGPAAPLYPSSQYAVCFVTSNAFGSQVGPEEQFATPPTPPAIDSESVPDVRASEATLQATINPNLQETTYLFEYSAKETGGTLENPVKVNGTATLPAELLDLPVSTQITGLTPNTTYYYRTVAENTTPLTANGPLQTLLTLPTPPAVSTGGSAAVTTHSANVTGTVNPSNSGQAEQDDTKYYFEYGQDRSYGKRSFPEPEAIGEGTSPVAETNTLGGLTAGRTYHYRVVASNDNNGTPQVVYGQDEAFTTTGTPPAPPSNGSGEAPPQSTSSTSTATVFPNLTGIVPVAFVKERGEAAPSEVKSLTRAQKLKKALKACRRSRGAKRLKCERRAHARYGKTTNRKGK